MVAVLLRKPFVAGGLRSPGVFLRFLHHEPISKPRPTSPSSPKSDLAVSFFKTSCGLSQSAALAAAAKTNIKTTANAESVLRLLGSYGFTKSNIARIATKFPVLFRFHPEKCIKPKLDLFVAEGFTENFIPKVFSKDPSLFNYSLERKLSPNLHVLMTILSGDKKAVATSISRSAWMLSIDLKKHVLPNMETLRNHRVTDTNVARLVTWWPRTIIHDSKRFSKAVAFLGDMGFDRSSTLFIEGILVIMGLRPPAWERKLQFYYSLGWSQEETLSAFKRSPLCMLRSEEKIRKVMTFFVENLKWEPSHLALRPFFLNYSLEKRIAPRCAVFKILSTSGLPKTNTSFLTLVSMSESNFLKYLCKYSDKIPELMEAYKVKLNMAMAVPSTLDL